MVHTFWSNQAFGWKYTLKPLCHSDFSSYEMHFPWSLKMLPNFGCSPSGWNINCREHWRFSKFTYYEWNLHPLVCTRRFSYLAQQREVVFDRHLAFVQVDRAPISDHNQGLPILFEWTFLWKLRALFSVMFPFLSCVFSCFFVLTSFSILFSAKSAQ